ncbi:hypothetical protein [Lasius neglectus virus 5]|nr:hypothetical protein [Lasius neglectus virus 5]
MVSIASLVKLSLEKLAILMAFVIWRIVSNFNRLTAFTAGGLAYLQYRRCMQAAPETIEIIEIISPTQLDSSWHVYVGFLLMIASVVLLLAVLWAPRVRMNKRKAISTQTMTVEASGFVAEKMVDGSVFTHAKSPAFQCEILGLSDGTWVRSGVGFRAGVAFITANHVIQNYKIIRLQRETSEGLKSVDVPLKRFKEVEGDLAKVVLSSQEIQTLRLASAKLNKHEVTDNSGLFTNVSAWGNSSMGLVKPHDAFGFVYYSGSTTGGFSGAPYYVGNKVYGMHLGGGGGNMGYDAAYISMLIITDQEDSDDYIMQQIMNYSKYEVERSPYDPDEYRLRVNGQYFLVDSDMVEQIRRTNSRGQRTVEYADYENEALEYPPTKYDFIAPIEKEHPMDGATDLLRELEQEMKKLLEAGNARAPAAAAAGATGNPSTSQASAPSPVPQPRKETKSVSSPKKTPTDGLKKTRAQQNEVLTNMLESLKLLRHAPAYYNKLRSKKLPDEQRNSSDFGRLTSLATQLEKLLSTIGLKEGLKTSIETARQAQASTAPVGQ